MKIKRNLKLTGILRSQQVREIFKMNIFRSAVLLLCLERSTVVYKRITFYNYVAF